MKTSLLQALKSGNPKALFAAFLYFDTGFTVWLLLGALAPFIAEALKLSDAQKGFMVAIPVLAATITRISFGYMFQAIEAKKIAFVGIVLSSLPLFYVQFFDPSFEIILLLGVFLGLGGASFAVALPMAGSNYPKEHQGLVLGLAAAGNLGAVLDGMLFPPLAKAFGWQAAMGFAIILLAITFFVVSKWAHDKSHKNHEIKKHAIFHFVASMVLFLVMAFVLQKGYLGVSGKTALLFLPAITSVVAILMLPKAYVALMKEKDMWVFILIYSITFGGFVGMSSYVSLFLISQYGFDKLSAGLLMSFFSLTGAMIRSVGGLIADKITGVRALGVILLLIAIFDAIIGFFMPPSHFAMVLLTLLFASFGLGNGATFQLVPQRWPNSTGMVTGLIGAAGGIGGFYLPAVLGLTKESTGSYSIGFYIFSGLALLAFVLLKLEHSKWMEWADVRYEEKEQAMVGIDDAGHIEKDKHID
ncbi:MAG: NarK/NasA family nitrate transporter [Campylobacteraceae bacterium]|jgi:NNP family nitrate/nitrite transporter-like MFS transporter|nr:NarK/NasA family nitrate transporter [Campylobacteraceae bacterium]